MRSSSWADVRERLLAALPVAMVVTAEAAWITVVYAAIDVAVGTGTLQLGIWAFVAGALAGRFVARRWSVATLLVGSIVVGACGWLLEPAVRTALAGPTPVSALATNAGGWLLGVAMWRGGRGLGSDATEGASLLTTGLFVLAIPWFVGTQGATATSFVEVALPATLVFAGAGLLAVGLARLEALGDDAGVDWRRNHSWLAMFVAVVLLMLVLGIPTASALGVSLDSVARSVLAPVSVATDVAAAAVSPLVEQISRPGPAIPPGSELPTTDPRWTEWFLGLAAIVMGAIAIALLVVLVRTWRSTPSEEDEELVIEQHLFVIPRPSFAIRRPPRIPGRRRNATRDPSTASEAYLVVLGRLAADPETARSAAENPSATRGACALLDAEGWSWIGWLPISRSSNMAGGR